MRLRHGIPNGYWNTNKRKILFIDVYFHGRFTTELRCVEPIGEKPTSCVAIVPVPCAKLDK